MVGPTSGRVGLLASRGALALAVLAAAATVSAGCAAGARRAPRAVASPVATAPADAPRPFARRLAAPGGSGFASFSGRASLRTDTPSLSEIEAAARAKAMAEQPRYGPYGPYGPQGGEGNAYVSEGGVVYVSGPYVAPGGAYGYPRTPHDGAPCGPSGGASHHHGTFSEPYRSMPCEADVQEHRPGLSTGSGVFARDAVDGSQSGRHR